MIITDDIITFEQSDIAQLSVELQTALAATAKLVTPEIFLSNNINALLKRALAERIVQKISAVRAGAEKATPAEKAQVDALIAQAEDILKIPAPIRLTDVKPNGKLDKQDK